MTSPLASQSHTLHGQVVVEDQGVEQRRSECSPEKAAELRRTRYVWTPPPDLWGEVPAGFELEFDCFAGSAGGRRFRPSKGFGALVVEAALGGFALLACRRGLSARQRDQYQLARLVWQQGPRLREYLSRALTREQDLYLPRAGRSSPDEYHILPEGLGLGRDRSGELWTPSALIERGREKAVEAGCTRPRPADCIRFGFLEAARRNPLEPRDLTRAETRNLVRLALFDLGPSSTGVSESVVRRVGERLRQALEGHLDDDTKEFHRWFFDGIDNLVHQIAKKKRPGSPLPREMVRQAMLEVVFRAFTRVGECVHQQMRAFREALPEPLRGSERTIFNSLYQGQAWLGGLPLILLYDRFDYLREAIMEIWTRPQDRCLRGALLRLLQYYGEMAAKRRAADRQYKRQRHHDNAAGGSAQVLTLDPDRDAITRSHPDEESSGARDQDLDPDRGEVPKKKPDLFQQIAAVLWERRRARCGCGSLDSWRARVVEAGTKVRPVVLEDMCGKCDHREEVRLSRQQFELIGRGWGASGHHPDH
jgi:hypothetical protein